MIPPWGWAMQWQGRRRLDEAIHHPGWVARERRRVRLFFRPFAPVPGTYLTAADLGVLVSPRLAPGPVTGRARRRRRRLPRAA